MTFEVTQRALALGVTVAARVVRDDVIAGGTQCGGERLDVGMRRRCAEPMGDHDAAPGCGDAVGVGGEADPVDRGEYRGRHAATIRGRETVRSRGGGSPLASAGCPPRPTTTRPRPTPHPRSTSRPNGPVGWPTSTRCRARGVDPYPVRFDRDRTLAELRAEFGDLEPGVDTDVHVRVAGRILLLRRQGKLTFATIRDQSGTVQLFVSRNVIGEEAHDAFDELDLGDWVGVEGTVMTTRKGELSVKVTRCELLAKALRPLPDKWHGLTDVDTRFRQRYVDLIMNEDSRRVFQVRFAAVAAIRRELAEHGFVEVETPVLEPRARRRHRPAVRHPPQRARRRPLPAHRARAAPEAARRRRVRASVRDRSRLPQRGHRHHATIPSSRCSRRTRHSPTTTT